MKFANILFLLLCFSCTQKITNSPVDADDAKRLTEEFYNNIKSDNLENIYTCLDMSVDKEEFAKLLVEHIKYYGDIKKKNIYEVETEHKSEVNEEIVRYKILLEISHENGNTIESLEFVKKNDSIKLMSYYFSPPKYR